VTDNREIVEGFYSRAEALDNSGDREEDKGFDKVSVKNWVL